jgi:hypothetical protein
MIFSRSSATTSANASSVPDIIYENLNLDEEKEITKRKSINLNSYEEFVKDLAESLGYKPETADLHDTIIATRLDRTRELQDSQNQNRDSVDTVIIDRNTYGT